MEQIIVNDEVFKRMHKAMGSAWTRRMTAEFGIDAVNFTKERFRRKDWHNQVHEPWKPRKRADRGSLMVRTGRLKRSIRKLVQGDAYVVIGTDVPYARIHNEGGKTKKNVYVRAHTRQRKPGKTRPGASGIINVKSHSRKMNLTLPQRQFLGKSRALELRLQLRLKKSVEGVLGNI